jgi:hypothetical protein
VHDNGDERGRERVFLLGVFVICLHWFGSG